ncbi:MAG TPA: hypothetical protein VEA44_05360 [Caulobacter sp.]|nr:hypothetical protein [Caulobacter sp.]
MRLLAPLIAAGLLLAPLAAAAQAPDEVVEAVYSEGQSFIPKEKLPSYYSRDLAAALARSQDSEDGGVGFDWLYDAQDAEITDLTFESIADGPDGSLIEARFKNFGEEKAVRWELCRRPNGEWRVVNVTGGDWTLRDLLELPETHDC